MQLAEKNILVTGGAKRFGAVLVRRLAEKGANVIIHCNKSKKEAEELLRELPGSGHRVITADLSVKGEAGKLFGLTAPLDAVINNASIYQHNGIYAPQQERDLFEVNYWSPMVLMRSMLPLSPQTEDKVVINVLDQEVLNPIPASGVYSASRRALRDATLEMAKKYGHLNIRFNAVAPGPMLPPAELPNSKMEKSIASLPLKRKVEMEHLADTIIFLLENTSITGAVIPVDCGQHL